MVGPFCPTLPFPLEVPTDLGRGVSVTRAAHGCTLHMERRGVRVEMLCAGMLLLVLGRCRTVPSPSEVICLPGTQPLGLS